MSSYCCGAFSTFSEDRLGCLLNRDFSIHMWTASLNTVVAAMFLVTQNLDLYGLQETDLTFQVFGGTVASAKEDAESRQTNSANTKDCTSIEVDNNLEGGDEQEFGHNISNCFSMKKEEQNMLLVKEFLKRNPELLAEVLPQHSASPSPFLAPVGYIGFEEASLKKISDEHVHPPEFFLATFITWSEYERNSSLSPYLQMSKTKAATSYYLSYGIEENIDAWLSTGNTKWLDTAIEYIENHIATAEPQINFEVRKYNDKLRGWPVIQSLQHLELRILGEYIQGEAQFARSVARMLWLMEIVPSVEESVKYRTKRYLISEWVYENIIGKWYFRKLEKGHEVGRQIFNHSAGLDYYSRWAHIALYFSQLESSNESQHLASVIYAQTSGPKGYVTRPGGEFRSVKSRLYDHPDIDDAYWWSDNWSKTPPGLGADVPHAGITAAFAADAISLGALGWNGDDLRKLRRTLNNLINPDTFLQSSHLAGGAMGTQANLAGWMRLAQRYTPNDEQGYKLQLLLQNTRPEYRNFRARHYAALMLNSATYHYDPAVQNPFNETIGALLGYRKIQYQH